MWIVSTLLSLPGVLSPGRSADVAAVKMADSPVCHPAGPKEQPVRYACLLDRSAVKAEDLSDLAFCHRLAELTVPLALGLLRLCGKNRPEDMEAQAVIHFALTKGSLACQLRESEMELRTPDPDPLACRRRQPDG